MRIGKTISGILAITALCIGATIAHGFGSVFAEVDTMGGATSKSGSFNQIPAGAQVILEAAAFNGSTAFVSANGCGVSVSLYDDSRMGGGNEYASTTSSGSISYDLSVSGTCAYTFVEIEWGYPGMPTPRW